MAIATSRTLFAAMDPDAQQPLFSDSKCVTSKNPQLESGCRSLVGSLLQRQSSSDGKMSTSTLKQDVMDLVHASILSNRSLLPTDKPLDCLERARDEMHQREQATTEEITKQQLQQYPRGPGKINDQGLFHCPKCHSKRTRYWQIQDRGKDEPPTTYIVCANLADEEKPQKQQCPKRTEEWKAA